MLVHHSVPPQGRAVLRGGVGLTAVVVGAVLVAVGWSSSQGGEAQLLAGNSDVMADGYWADPLSVDATAHATAASINQPVAAGYWAPPVLRPAAKATTKLAMARKAVPIPRLIEMAAKEKVDMPLTVHKPPAPNGIVEPLTALKVAKSPKSMLSLPVKAAAAAAKVSAKAGGSVRLAGSKKTAKEVEAQGYWITGKGFGLKAANGKRVRLEGPAKGWEGGGRHAAEDEVSWLKTAAEGKLAESSSGQKEIEKVRELARKYAEDEYSTAMQKALHDAMDGYDLYDQHKGIAHLRYSKNAKQAASSASK